jgi:type II secretion system protein N
MIRQLLQRARTRRRERKAPITRERALFMLASLLLLAVSFLLGFYLFFPGDMLKARLEEELARSAMDIEVEEVSLRFPPALLARQIHLHTGQPNRPPLLIATALVAPSWSTLFGSDPGLSFRSAIGGGRVQGTIRRSGALEAEAAQVAFAEPLVANSPLVLAGTIGRGQLSAIVPPTASSDARLTVTITEVRLTGLEGFGVSSGALSLGTVLLQGSGKGNNYRIDQLESSGGDLEVSGGGTLLLAATAERSRLNLSLTLRPAATLDASLKELLSLLAKPARDGSLRLRVTGTLASPSLQ